MLERKCHLVHPQTLKPYTNCTAEILEYIEDEALKEKPIISKIKDYKKNDITSICISGRYKFYWEDSRGNKIEDSPIIYSNNNNKKNNYGK